MWTFATQAILWFTEPRAARAATDSPWNCSENGQRISRSGGERRSAEPERSDGLSHQKSNAAFLPGRREAEAAGPARPPAPLGVTARHEIRARLRSSPRSGPKRSGSARTRRGWGFGHPRPGSRCVPGPDPQRERAEEPPTSLPRSRCLRDAGRARPVSPIPISVFVTAPGSQLLPKGIDSEPPSPPHSHTVSTPISLHPNSFLTLFSFLLFPSPSHAQLIPISIQFPTSSHLHSHPHPILSLSHSPPQSIPISIHLHPHTHSIPIPISISLSGPSHPHPMHTPTPIPTSIPTPIPFPSYNSSRHPHPIPNSQAGGCLAGELLAGELPPSGSPPSLEQERGASPILTYNKCSASPEICTTKPLRNFLQWTL